MPGPEPTTSRCSRSGREASGEQNNSTTNLFVVNTLLMLIYDKKSSSQDAFGRSQSSGRYTTSGPSVPASSNLSHLSRLIRGGDDRRLDAFSVSVGTRVAVSVEGNYGLVQDGTWREYMVA
ncbi:MAG: hypothetical protein ACJ8BW_30950 [Ktedonobacteraceae bacterium]